MISGKRFEPPGYTVAVPAALSMAPRTPSTICRSLLTANRNMAIICLIIFMTNKLSVCVFFRNFAIANHTAIITTHMKVIVSDEIENVCPAFIGAHVEIYVKNTIYSDGLWNEIHRWGEYYRQKLDTESLKNIPAIAATRLVYKACGKDPSRYRPAAEALIRRMLQGKDLYQINTLVDLVNLASIKYGYSIGGFDADKFHGTTLTLGVGKAGEPYEGIGRGNINIEGLPVYRDLSGGVGTPTSDNERTKIDMETTHLVVLVNGYDGNEENVRANAEYILQLAGTHCQGHDGSYYIYR